MIFIFFDKKTSGSNTSCDTDKSETISNYLKRFLINLDAKLICFNKNQTKYGQIKEVNFTIGQ